MNLETANNTKSIALVLFAIFALAYLIAWLLISGGIWSETANTVINFIDLPTYLVGIVFLSSKTVLDMHLLDGEHAHKAVAIWVLATAIMFGLIILDFSVAV